MEKMDIINSNWINLSKNGDRTLINLNSLSNISTYSIPLENEFLIILAPNAGVYDKDSDDSHAIWDANFTGGKYCISYKNREDWENDFNKIIDTLKEI